MSILQFFSISNFLVFSLILFSGLLFSVGLNSFDSTNDCLSSLLLFDSLSFYFLGLVVVLGVYSQYYFFSGLDSFTRLFLWISVSSSCLSFIVNHAILFWVFYELSMLPLLYLIFKSSPYSERFLAGWYFSCYLVVTSLPLILILYYIGLINDSFLFDSWVINEEDSILLILLSFIFFTKVPLIPFHTWLPIVHAEATSIVSIFLSGYIMKLGLLGVCRCCNCIFDNDFIIYLFICLIMCIMFLVTSCSELDGKRWLAFLSLSHIVIPFFGFFISDYSFINYSYFYCLGHGLSAGIVFGLLWCLYDMCNSRNWILMKTAIGSSTVLWYTLFSILSLCSFPTTIQFFCEISLVYCCYSKFIYMLFWVIYLFVGGLVPLVLLGHCFIRCEYVESADSNYWIFFNFLFFLLFWCYFGLFLI